MEYKKFFIFTDIRGSLIDESYAKSVEEVSIKPESAEAMNYLIEQIKRCGFCPEIVITSEYRKDKDFVIGLLKQANIDDSVNIDFLPIDNQYRNEQIIRYLKNKTNGIVATKRTNQILPLIRKFSNYVVIDDDYDILERVPKEQYIQTSYHFSSLTKKMVNKFIRNKNMQTIDYAEK